MLRVDLQFYAFFMTTLSGMALGVLFDVLRVLRGYYRPGRWVAALADLLFWGAATLALAVGLFMGNWGDFRFYVLIAILVGLGLYEWLASPAVLALLYGLLRFLTWLLELLWAPVVALATLLAGTARLLWQGALRLAGFTGRLLAGLGRRLSRPLIRPYRCAKLYYLLAKRRVKRTLRRWLLGAKGPRRR